MFNKQKTDPKVEVLKMSSLSIAWALAAAVAYLGFIRRAIDLVKASTPWSGPGVDVDAGLSALTSANLGAVRLSGTLATLADFAVKALPVAIVVALAMGAMVRVRPKLARVGSAGLLAAALLGLAGTLTIFSALVATRRRGTDILVAVATIVLVAILLRVQRFVRRFYRRSPAFATLLFAALAITYVVMANGVNISSIVLSQIDAWLAILSFAILLYAGVRIARQARRLS